MLVVYRLFLYLVSVLNWGIVDVFVLDSINCCRWIYYLSVDIFIILIEMIGFIVLYFGCFMYSVLVLF